MMSSNSEIIADNDGDFNDWVELYNNSDSPISLQGYGFTDNPSQPFKWIFPDITLAPNAHLIIWCSDKNRTNPALPLHTNWKIGAEGEDILLSYPDGTSAYLLPAASFPANFSYGHSHDANGNFVYFSTPTPGSPNQFETGFSEILDPPSFSVPSGFYNSGFPLTLSTHISGATIIYTTDGSEPDENNLAGKTYQFKNVYPENPGDPTGEMLSKTIRSQTYSSPLNVIDRSVLPNSIAQISTSFHANAYYFPAAPVLKGTVIRAKVIKDGAMSSPAITSNYFISQAGPGTFSLPVVAISVDNDDYFDYEDGINVAGKDFDDWRIENPTEIPHGATPANYVRSGSSWEKKGNFSFFENDLSVMNQDIGIRIHGGQSRQAPNRSFRIYGRSEYGTGTFNHSIFPTSNDNSFKRLIFRNSGGDTYSSMFRDAFIQTLVRHLNFETQDYQPSVVFLNAEYWGIFNIRERFDTKYFERVYNVDEDDLDYLEANSIVDEGDASHYNSMLDFIENNSLSDQANYTHVNTMMDVDNFIDHFITNIYIANTDWPHNNIEYWRKRTAAYEPNAPYGHDGRWRWVLKDTDFGFGGSGMSNAVQHNTLAYVTAPTGFADNDWSNFLLRNLLENDTFKTKFITRFADVMNSAFVSNRVTSVLDEMKSVIAPEMQRHINRWNHIGSISNWNNNVAAMAQFATNRATFQRNHIRSEFGISNNISVILDVSNTDHGFVKINTIDINESTPGINPLAYPWTGIYFHNIPVTLKAIPHAGYTFSHWSGESSSTDVQITITSATSFSITAHFIISDEPLPTEPLYFWVMDGAIPNDTPLETLNATFEIPNQAHIEFDSAFEGYPFASTHANWRKASMERRNSPTPINYIPEANNGLVFEDSNMKALQVTQPFQNNGRENTMTFHLPTNNYEQIKFAFTAKDEGAADAIVIDYSVVSGTPVWETSGLQSTTLALSGNYHLFETDFSSIPTVNNNANFKVRLRFTGSNMTASNGNRVTFNNISLTGAQQLNSVDIQKSFSVYPNPVSDILYIKHHSNKVSYRIFSVDGKFVREGIATTHVELSNLSPGLYLLQLSTDDYTEVKKIIKR